MLRSVFVLQARETGAGLILEAVSESYVRRPKPVFARQPHEEFALQRCEGLPDGFM
jgi:hypothetical protein